MNKVRGEFGLDNVIPMVPFCRTLDEGKKVVQIIRENGIKGKIYVMCEIPANVILAEQFLQIFDGFSIGSNDLTQLTLGVDRDSGFLASMFDERDPAVKKMLLLALEGAHRAGKYISICGQAPSDFPEIADLLIDHGISALSLNPDAVFSFLMRKSSST